MPGSFDSLPSFASTVNDGTSGGGPPTGGKVIILLPLNRIRLFSF